MVKSLGADVAVDYHSQDFETTLAGYDVVLDVMSYKYEHRTLWGEGSAGLFRQDGTGHYLNIMSSDWQHSPSGQEIANGKCRARGRSCILHARCIAKFLCAVAICCLAASCCACGRIVRAICMAIALLCYCLHADDDEHRPI